MRVYSTISRVLTLELMRSALRACMNLDPKLCAIMLQELMQKVGVLGHVMPLLFGYDVTHQEADDDAAAASLDHSATQRGPAFLGLSIERSNMQVRCRAMPASLQDERELKGSLQINLKCRLVECE